MSISAGQQTAVKAQPAAAQRAARDRRVEAAFTEARRHSGRVRLLKFALPAAALAMIVAFAARSWLAAPGGLPVDIGALAIEGGRLVMSDPRLDGVTGSHGRPYSMTAARAVQDIGVSGRIDLQGIDARLPVDESGWMTVTAPSGVFDRDANRLDIDSELTMTGDNGLKAVLQSAVLDIAAGSLDTADPVDITLEGAHISADSMAVRDRGAVLIFENRVRMRIEGGRLSGAAADGSVE
jgi:lipopolysaccharide export system protein LptC